MRFNTTITLWFLALTLAPVAGATRQETLLRQWKFSQDSTSVDQPVTVPHDWAIYGPFSRDNDLQVVAIEQNKETKAEVKTGRTGGLPFIGKGFYATTFNLEDTTGRSITLVFDGVMSNARVKVNGKDVCYWPYGYNSFYVDLDGVAVPGENTVEVRAENMVRQSRWYPGAGIYRNVHLVETDKVHVPVWGTYITTPDVTPEQACVKLITKVAGTNKGQHIDVVTRILDANGNEVTRGETQLVAHGQPLTQNFLVEKPALWSPESPTLYSAVTTLSVDGKEVDSYTTRFGIRNLEYIPHKGFFLNGQPRKFKGVCNHHDLGPLGAAINRSAIRHQLKLLKDMGCDAIRTSHNMPAPELVELCDEMGVMLMIEPFDDWSAWPKSPNGYGRIFNEWAARDITNMVEHYRNSPSVVMWSIGNEVPSQWSPDGVAELSMLQDLVHQLDPTRPVTCGMDQVAPGAVLDNGFAAALDIPGFNYKPTYYDRAYRELPQKLVLGSETASTVSSRGVYHFPVVFRGQENVYHEDHQSSSYDCENQSWSNVPDDDFAADDDKEFVIGQFVWTGFDYLGEPGPYDTDAWPNHSSMYGIIDLASIPKDRFYLYRSKWNTDSPTLHILPHWNWKGREGEVTPVHVYTSYHEAELFVNGKSQGRRTKDASSRFDRYRLRWNDVVYEPGEIKVVAYDAQGNKAEEQVIHTAGKAHHLVITPSCDKIHADGDELVYFTVQVADKDGNLCPTDSREVKFNVKGEGHFLATANGDPCSLRSFQEPKMDLFSGAATAIAQASDHPGELVFTASAPGVKSASVTINVE